MIYCPRNYWHRARLCHQWRPFLAVRRIQQPLTEHCSPGCVKNSSLTLLRRTMTFSTHRRVLRNRSAIVQGKTIGPNDNGNAATPSAAARAIARIRNSQNLKRTRTILDHYRNPTKPIHRCINEIIATLEDKTPGWIVIRRLIITREVDPRTTNTCRWSALLVIFSENCWTIELIILSIIRLGRWRCPSKRL